MRVGRREEEPPVCEQRERGRSRSGTWVAARLGEPGEPGVLPCVCDASVVGRPRPSVLRTSRLSQPGLQNEVLWFPPPPTTTKEMEKTVGKLGRGRGTRGTNALIQAKSL